VSLAHGGWIRRRLRRAVDLDLRKLCGEYRTADDLGLWCVAFVARVWVDEALRPNPIQDRGASAAVWNFLSTQVNLDELYCESELLLISICPYVYGRVVLGRGQPS